MATVFSHLRNDLSSYFLGSKTTTSKFGENKEDRWTITARKISIEMKGSFEIQVFLFL